MALLGGALLLLVVLLLQGPAIFGLVGKGGGFVVDRAVRLIVFRDVSPVEEESTSTGRVVLAGGPPASLGAATAAPGGAPEEEAPVPQAVELVPVDLRSPAEEEVAPLRKEFDPYRSFGLRDPMSPLVTPGQGDERSSRFSIYSLTLVGVAWKNGEIVALCEDPLRRGYLFREGEWLEDGARVRDITEDSVTFAQVRYGETSLYTLRLTTREEEN